MAHRITVALPKNQGFAPRYPTRSSRASTWLRTPWYTAVFTLSILFLVNCTSTVHSVVPPPVMPVAYSPATVAPDLTEERVQYQVSLIRDHLSAYLDFLGSEVLPVMSQNVDEILYNLNGLTDIRPGLFYHGHIDYSTDISGGINGLMDMNNVLLQYHTLENPMMFLPYWREELGNIQDPEIDAWLGRVNEYNRAISTPSTASETQYTPLTKEGAAIIASEWDGYRVQNGLASPGGAMLLDMVYLVDGGRQPLYQDAFKNIYKYHSIAFSPEGYLQLDNQTHLENTFSPFQINFEKMDESLELLPVFEEARNAGLGYIINVNNAYVAQDSQLHDPEMVKLSLSLSKIINDLPSDNLMKISNSPNDEQIAFFAVGNYVFAVHGSLDSPSIFK